MSRDSQYLDLCDKLIFNFKIENRFIRVPNIWRYMTFSFPNAEEYLSLKDDLCESIPNRTSVFAIENIDIAEHFQEFYEECKGCPIFVEDQKKPTSTLLKGYSQILTLKYTTLLAVSQHIIKGLRERAVKNEDTLKDIRHNMSFKLFFFTNDTLPTKTLKVIVQLEF